MHEWSLLNSIGFSCIAKKKEIRKLGFYNYVDAIDAKATMDN